MSKYIFSAAIVFASFYCYSQNDNGKYINQPFPINSASGKAVVAGEVNTFVYSNYYGKDVKKENYTNSHAKPEYLVYELFHNMQIKNLNAIDKLYDSSFNRKDFEGNPMAERLKDYEDIKFCSKFKTGDRIIIRYDFISKSKHYPFFAAIKKIQGEYYLTMDLNLSDPFNVVGSLSPYNLLDKSVTPANIDQLKPFYFTEKENRIFFTNEKPDEDYTAVYLEFEHYDENSKAPEIAVLKELQKAVQSKDSSEMENMLLKNDRSLLANPYYSSYLYDELRKVFRNYSIISPLVSIQTNAGKIIYFKFSNPGQSSNIASIVLKKWGYNYYVALQMASSDLNNILQNVYVREAIYDYFKRQL